MTVNNVEAGAGVSNHTVAYSVSAGNRLRILVYSLDNSRFSGTDAPIFVVHTDVSTICGGDMSFGEITAVDASVKPHLLNSVGGNQNLTSDIDDIERDAEFDAADIYDITGTLVRRGAKLDSAGDASSLQLNKGIYILRQGKKSKKIVIR